MTQNKDRKQAIRARMAATGEPYTAAARNLGKPESPDETANLVAAITQAYRDRADGEAEPGITAVPGRVTGGDIEGQADALADDASRLAALLTAFTQEPRRSMDVIAVFRRLSETAASMESVAVELRRQEWFDLDDSEDPEASAAWSGALEGLRSAAATFEWVADGWI
jgi:hypothetical protein